MNKKEYKQYLKNWKKETNLSLKKTKYKVYNKYVVGWYKFYFWVTFLFILALLVLFWIYLWPVIKPLWIELQTNPELRQAGAEQLKGLWQGLKSINATTP